MPAHSRHKGGPNIRHGDIQRGPNLLGSFGIDLGRMSCPTGMGSILCIVKVLELVLVDRRRSNDDDTGILGLGGGVLDELSEVLFVDFQRDMLHMDGYTCIICAKENGLVLLVVVEMRVPVAAGRSYHEPDIGGLRRGENLVEDFDRMSSCISSVENKVS